MYTSFACFGFHFKVAPKLKSDWPGFEVYSELPSFIDASWKPIIGEFAYSQVKNFNCLFYRAERSEIASDAAIERVLVHMRHFRLALALTGLPYYFLTTPLIFSGSSIKGVSQIRTVSYEPHIFRSEFDVKQFGEVDMHETYTFGQKLLELSKVQTPFRRLRRGLSALVRGVQEYEALERLHQFVRAIEAVVVPEMGTTRVQFMRRGSLFANGDERSKQFLGDLFDLRSCIEHMNDVRELAAKIKPKVVAEEVVGLRAFQAESLARRIYRAILLNEELLDHFETDSKTHQFWTKRESKSVPVGLSRSDRW